MWLSLIHILLDGLFILCGIAVMVQFLRAAHHIEPFTAD